MPGPYQAVNLDSCTLLLRVPVWWLGGPTIRAAVRAACCVLSADGTGRDRVNGEIGQSLKSVWLTYIHVARVGSEVSSDSGEGENQNPSSCQPLRPSIQHHQNNVSTGSFESVQQKKAERARSGGSEAPAESRVASQVPTPH